MAERRFSDQSLMLMTLVVAVILTVLPVSDLLRPIWPHWVALVMIYWVLEGNRLRHLGEAFVLGLVVDVVSGSLLGQHALSLLIISFLLERFRNPLRFFPPWQQAVGIMALLFNDRIIQLWIVVLADEPWPPIMWWLSPLVGMMLWPWLFLALDALRQTRRLPNG